MLAKGGIERFLKTRGGWLPADEQDLVESWQQVPVRLYEVRDVRSGTGVNGPYAS